MTANFREPAVEQLSALGVLGGVGVDLVVLALVVGERVWEVEVGKHHRRVSDRFRIGGGHENAMLVTYNLRAGARA